MRFVTVLFAVLVFPAVAVAGGVKICDCDYSKSAVWSGTVTGSVENGSKRDICFVKVEVYFADEAGVVLKNTVVYCSPHTLGPGESADFSFDIPEDVSIDHQHTRLDVKYRYR